MRELIEKYKNSSHPDQAVVEILEAVATAIEELADSTPSKKAKKAE